MVVAVLALVDSSSLGLALHVLLNTDNAALLRLYREITSLRELSSLGIGSRWLR